MNDPDYYDRARKKVEEKKKFHNHLRAYIIVNMIMLFTGTFFRGWITAAFFWGVGVFFHFIKAYNITGTEDWEEQEIEKEVKRMKARDKYKNKRNPPHDFYKNEEDDFNMDDYLDLNQPKPMPRKKYDEEDLV